MNTLEELQNSLQKNNQEITALRTQNLHIANQLWELQYKEHLGQKGFCLNDILMLFAWDNHTNPLLTTFQEKVSCTDNSMVSLLEMAKQYGMVIPDVVMDIVCETCVCNGCNTKCFGTCEECKKRYGEWYSSYCDD